MSIIFLDLVRELESAVEREDDGNTEVTEFDLPSLYYVHFRTNTLGKVMKSLIPPTHSYGLNSTNIILYQEWFWH